MKNRILAIFLAALMMISVLPISVLADGAATRTVTYYNPVTGTTDSATVAADTKVFAVWADGLEAKVVFRQGTSFDDGDITTLSGTLCYGTASNPVIYVVIGSVAVSGTIETQNPGQYIVGANNTGAALTRNCESDLIRVYHNFGLYNITLDGSRSGNVRGGLIAFDGGISEMSNVTLRNNTVNYVQGTDGKSSQYGTGAVRIGTDGTATVTMSNCLVTGNKTNGDGAGIYIGDKGTLTLKDSSITGNAMTDNGHIGTYGHGAGIFMDGTLTLEGTNTVTGNTRGTALSNLYLKDDVSLGSTFNTASKIGIDNVNDAEVFAIGNGTTGDGYDPTMSKAFSHDNCAAKNCHVDKTANGLIFCTNPDHVPVPVECTVTFNSNGGSSVASQTVTSGEKATKPADPTLYDHTFVEWQDETGIAFNFDTPITEDITLTAKWKKVERYPVNVYVRPVDSQGKLLSGNDGSSYNGNADIYVSGSKHAGYILNTSTLTNAGFAGYNDTDNVWLTYGTFNQTITKAEAVLASIQAGLASGKYTITKSSATIKTNTSDITWIVYNVESLPKANPNLNDDVYHLDGYVTFYSATFAAGTTETVTGMPTAQYNNTIYDYYVNGQTFTLPAAPTRDGYTFSGWSDGTSTYTAGANYTINAKDVTFTALWEMIPPSVTYTLTYNANTTDTVANMPDPLTVTQTTPNFQASAAVPTRTGYTFKGWALKADATDAMFVAGQLFYNEITNFTLYAVWEKNTYDVTFYLGGGNVSGNTSAVVENDVPYGTKLNTIAPTPVQDGYTLLGWYVDGDASQTLVSSNMPITADTKLQAKWEKGIWLTYDANAGTDTVDNLPAAHKPEKNATFVVSSMEPTRTGYMFLGWSLNKDATVAAYVGGDTITNNGESFTLYAIWQINTCTVTFDSNGGSAVNPQTVNYGAKATKPTDPTRDGYAFLGWYNGNTAFDFDTPITDAITLTAKWQQLYTVTFDAAGGAFWQGSFPNMTFLTTLSYQTNADGKLSTLAPTPFCSGYRFMGWYTARFGGKMVTLDTVYTANTTVYAHWLYNGTTGGTTIITPTKPTTPEDLNTLDHTAYVNGYDDGTVRPQGQITRAETATMLFRLLTDERRAEIRTTNHSFTDIPANAWYREAVATMANGGYITGYEDGTFRGDQAITRAEFVAILARFINVQKAETIFKDVSSDHWAHDAIATATIAEWLTGYADGTFGPDTYITRAEAMTIINRALGRGVDSTSELLNFKVWPDNSPDAWYYYEVIEATNDHKYTGKRPNETWTALN